MVNEVIFKSRESYRNFIKHYKLYSNGSEEQIEEVLMREGYIRKSLIEEAEEFLNKNVQVWSFENRELVARGFWELKSEIERLKSCQK